MDIKRVNPTARWSDATTFNRITHFVEVPANTEQDMVSQTLQIFSQAESTLATVSTDKSCLLSATIYITAIENLAVFNSLWESWIPEGCAPSRACIKVELLDPHMLIEIAFVAGTR